MIRSRTQNSIAAHPLGTPELPDFAVTISGVQFDPRSDRWCYQDGLDRVNIEFNSIRRRLSGDLVTTFKAVLVHAAQEIAPVTLISYHSAMEQFTHSLSQIPSIEIIDEASVRHFWGDPNVRGKTKYIFKWIINRWAAHRYARVEQSAFNFLMRQKDNHPVIGESVLTWNPVTGPLTDIEFKSYYENLSDLYAEEKISRELFLMAWVVTSLGVRPRQVALLKVCDVFRKSEGDVSSYWLSMPRIKQSGQIPRDEMYEWPIISEIGKSLHDHADAQKAKFVGLLDDVNQAPLFSFGAQRIAAANSEHGADAFSADQGHTENQGRTSPDNLEFHLPTHFFITRLKGIFEALDVSSERVGKNIVITARRLRKTYGTRLAAENVPAPVLASMLGHRDIKSSRPYIAATSRLQDRLDKSMTFELAPLAQAFRGEFLSARDSRTDGEIIRDLRIVPSGEQLGKCDKTGYCGFAAPVACYTCKKFRPWKDAPHELIFNFLWERRESRATESDKNAHMTMLHDRTILAVAQVILQCKEASTDE